MPVAVPQASISERRTDRFLNDMAEALGNGVRVAAARNDPKWDWRRNARPSQLAPDWGWIVWLLLAGRGFGKTRSACEATREAVESEQYGRIAIVGRTAADVRDVIVEGDSGLLAICPPWNRPEYEPSKRRLTWPNGATATTFSAEEPDMLRGPNIDWALCDETASWSHVEPTWNNLMFTLRRGKHPRAVVATTPRPIPLIKRLLKDPTVAVTRGSTYENRDNLAPAFFEQIIRPLEGTRIARQEIDADVLEDVEGALWTLTQLDALRVAETPPLKRIVVAVDPSANAGEEGLAETGIVVAGLGQDGCGYVIEDASLRGSPHEWATAAVEAYRRHQADRIVAEANQGGAMVEHVLRTVDPRVPITLVHASRGKQTRAEPIAALYEQSRVRHVGTFPKLEDQMTSWVPGEASPDRMDALVWALSELFVLNPVPEFVVPLGLGRSDRSFLAGSR
jgi:phage terminase large subunit-like protein